MKFRNHHAGCCGLNPTRPDGTEWAHVMLLHDGSQVHADTPAEVLGELMPGYERLDDEQRRLARIGHAERLALAAQEAKIAAATASGNLDPLDPDAGGLMVVLRSARSEALQFEDDDAPGEPMPWLGSPELVLVTTSYAPHGDVPRVEGNVQWLDPETDESYLASLRDTGLFSYWAADAT